MSTLANKISEWLSNRNNHEGDLVDFLVDECGIVFNDRDWRELNCVNCDVYIARDSQEHDEIHINEDDKIFCRDCLDKCNCFCCNEDREVCTECGYYQIGANEKIYGNICECDVTDSEDEVEEMNCETCERSINSEIGICKQYGCMDIWVCKECNNKEIEKLLDCANWGERLELMEENVDRTCFKCEKKYRGSELDCCCGSCCNYCKEPSGQLVAV